MTGSPRQLPVEEQRRLDALEAEEMRRAEQLRDELAKMRPTPSQFEIADRALVRQVVK